jgi:predicted GTPase
MSKKNVIIIGAAGRDFHNFNTYYRNNDACNVVAFTAAQIPDIEGRKYPAELAGELYPDGISIYAEEDLAKLIKDLDAEDCVFSYSDVSYQHVMSVGAKVNAAGANFVMLGPKHTQIIRHPMPYGDIAAQKVQRFAELSDLEKHNCTVEEMEEYEPHVVRGNVIYAGVDYEAIVRAAEEDPDGCDIILWDGGNNDFPFYQSDLHVTVVDPHRPGHELTYYPGNVTLRIADVVVINKMDSADAEGIEVVRRNIASEAPDAIVIDGASTLDVDDPSVIRGKRVLVVEDGPTLTHGNMKIGAGVVAARKFGAAELVDPRPYTVGRLTETFKIYPEIGTLLPAMGYGEVQLKDMETTINSTECDAVVIATPIDLNRIIKIKKPNTRVYYNLQEIGRPNFEQVLADFVKKHNLF